MASETKHRIKAFIASNFQSHDFQYDEDIFSIGFVNSLFALQLVMFLEKEFSIKVEDDDIELDNFRTINAMTALVEKKLGVLS